MSSAFDPNVLSAIYSLGLQHGSQGTDPTSDFGDAVAQMNAPSAQTPKTVANTIGNVNLKNPTTQTLPSTNKFGTMNKTMAGDAAIGTGQQATSTAPVAAPAGSTVNTVDGTTSATPENGNFTYDDTQVPKQLPTPTTATAAQMTDAMNDPWAAQPTSVSAGSVTQTQATQAAGQAKYDQSIIDDINSGMSAGDLQAKYGPRWGTVMANYGASGAKWTDNATMLSGLVGYLQGDISNANKVDADFSNTQTNAFRTGVVNTLQNTNTLQNDAAKAAVNNYNNAAANAASAGGAMSGHAAAYMAGQTQAVNQANMDLAKAGDQVNGATAALNNVENNINMEMQNHTLDANTAISQMNDTLDSVLSDLTNTQGQDALNMRTQAAQYKAQLENLQNLYSVQRINVDQFWSMFSTIMSGVGKFATAVVGAAA